MDKTLTPEQYRTLSQLESYLQTATNANYIRSLSMEDARRLFDVYLQIFNRSLNLRCPKCVLEMCKNLGKLYYNYKKEEDERQP